MVMTLWKSFGASVRGPGHITEGLPNQDAWMSFHHAWGMALWFPMELAQNHFPISEVMPCAWQ